MHACMHGQITIVNICCFNHLVLARPLLNHVSCYNTLLQCLTPVSAVGFIKILARRQFLHLSGDKYHGPLGPQMASGDVYSRAKAWLDLGGFIEYEIFVQYKYVPKVPLDWAVMTQG